MGQSIKRFQEIKKELACDDTAAAVLVLSEELYQIDTSIKRGIINALENADVMVTGSIATTDETPRPQAQQSPPHLRPPA